MKLLGIILIIVITGCGQVSQTERKDDTNRQAIDTTSQNESQKEKSRFPDWLSKLYPKELKLKYRKIDQELTDFKKVNDTVSFCTFKKMGGVCIRYFLETYVNRTQKDSLKIGHQCDHDLSQPTYSWKEFELKSSNIIMTTEYIKSVHDSLIDENSRMKKGFDFMEAETTIDTINQVYQVNSKGLIIEIKK